VIHWLSTMPLSTKFQRSWALSGFLAGSQFDGAWMTPASIAPSDTVRSATSLSKYAFAAAWMP
jgi:hypothetical protein